MGNEIMKQISALVAEAINQEAYDTQKAELDRLLNGFSAQEKWDALESSYITGIMTSQPGCLPDAWSAYPMDADPNELRNEIMMYMGGDDFEDDGMDWNAMREKVAALNLAGDRMVAPDGRIIEIFRQSCSSVLGDNGIRV